MKRYAVIFALSLVIARIATAQSSVEDDFATTDQNVPVTVDVLANDSGDWADGDFFEPANGSLSVTPDGTMLIYSPNLDFVGIDQFVYTLTDTNDDEFEATVTVTVLADGCDSNEDCNDGAFCNGTETCVANTCVAGTPPSEDDGVACTVEICDEASDAILHTPNDALCSNGQFCDGAEVCNLTLGCEAGAPPVLDDGVGCTNDGCDEVGDVVVHTTDDGLCDNGLFCDGAETCDAVNDCQPGLDPCAGLGCNEVEATCEAPPGPEALDDTAITEVNTPVTVDVLANDTGDWVSGDFSFPQNGSLSATPDETMLIYSPDLDFVGSDNFLYTLTDIGGAEVSADVTISVLAPGATYFTDVTVSAGITHTQHSLANSMLVYGHPGAMSGGAAAGDYNGDGFQDLYVTRLDAADLLYRNNGDGTFTDVAIASGINRGDSSNAAGWADLDNDGDQDLYVTSLADTRFYLYVNDGTGSFTEEAVSRGADIGGPDLHYGYSVSFGDYDGDGFLDIHTCEWRIDGLNPTAALSNSRLLRNLGAVNPGHFEDVTQAAGVALDGVVGGVKDGTFSFSSRFTDLDADGLLDLAIASDFSESRLFWNNGNGTFTDGTVAAGVGTEQNGMGNAVGDVDGDGLLDWFVTSINANTGNRLFLNNGNRTFTDATDAGGVRDGYWGWGATFLDYDNDGDLDLAEVNGVDFPNGDDAGWETDPMRFWQNDGAASFTELSASIGLTDSRSGKGILSFDYDNDGDLDLFVTNNGAASVLYQNENGNTRSWLRVKTFGTLPSLNAKITVTADGQEQFRETLGGNNFLSQDENAAHFGLGSGVLPVDEVAIEWQEGGLQSLFGVARNTTVAIARGSGNATYVGTSGLDYVLLGDSDDQATGGGDADLFGLALAGGDDTITDFIVGDDRLVLLGGQAFSGDPLSEDDVNTDGTQDTIVTFADGSTVTLLGVNGVTDVNDLI